MKINLLNAILLAMTWLSGGNLLAAVVAHYPFEPDDSGLITETVSGDSFQVLGNFGAESQPGVKGEALFLDGYTSYVGARVRCLPVDRKMTVSLWVAVPSYPVIEVDSPDPGGQTCIVNCLDDEACSGFGYFLGFDGQYSFQVYVGGEKAIVNVPAPLPRNRWNCLTAVVDADACTLRFYNNGEEVASTSCNGGDISVGDATLHIAQDGWEIWFGSGDDAFRTTAFGGLIDELTILDYAASPDEIKGWRADASPVLTAPDGRYAGDKWHPRFHGCPSANWTNEPHGLVYADGRYHLFFQKNAAGPYMARLHWGHLTSTNLYDWQEERIALAPGEPYDKDNGNRNGLDMKGCWSGCVVTDAFLNGGRPTILYTGVDYSKARILEATPADNSLLVWNKNTTPLIDGCPAGFSDDFRDPYFYREDDQSYIMVGCSKENRGAVTRHRYENGSWTSNEGEFAYHAWDTGADGTYIEMPALTRLPDGMGMSGEQWLFVYTPIGTSQGVKTMYRTGHIDNEGIFVTDGASATSRGVDLFGRDGFGLLSPSIMTRDGRVTAIGLVPDKLGSADNKANGWAHCYSLPRDWTVDNAGNLWQKPAPELAGMRSSTSFNKNDFNLSGTQVLAGVEGREAEVRATFTCGDSPVGIRFFKNPANPDDSHAALIVDPAANTVAINLRHLPRIVNDGSPYDGLYQATLPDDIAPGKEVTVDLFIDHSVADLFVNDRYAASVRIFPHDDDGTRIEMYADASTSVKSLDGWVLDSPRAVTPSGATLPARDATPRVAILIAGDNVDELNPQERAAVELFKSLYPEGTVLTPGDVASRLSLDNYGTLWIHVDRLNVGSGNLPESLTSQQVLDALGKFHADGGHMLLTKQAVQLVSRIGRIDPAYAPGIYADGDGDNGDDVWTLNAQIGWWQLNPDNGSQDSSQYYDWRTHPIYAGLTTSQTYAWESYPMEGTGDGTAMWREDHNCVWDLNSYSYSVEGKNTVERFQNQNNCSVIGTWGQVEDYAVAGVVEFLPQSVARSVTMSGRILANGLAACELAPRYGGNTYTANVERLNANSLSYLVADDRGPTVNVSGVEETVADNKPSVFPVDYVGVGYSGAEPGSVLTVVSVDGRMIARHVLTDSDGVVGTSFHGVAVVTVGDLAVKLLLK